MALFQRKPDAGSSMPLYSLGLHKSMIVVGLGNIGEKYDGTRHNIGFAAVDALATSQEFDPWTDKKDLKCVVTSKTIGDTRVILCKPSTLMNLSGEAVQAISHFYKIESTHIVVVHDELDIPFGQIRTRVGGSDAGHNGIKSIHQYLGESADKNIGRIRIGIAPASPTKLESADFVLAKFSTDESNQLKNLLQESTAILTETIHAGTITHETRNFLI